MNYQIFFAIVGVVLGVIGAVKILYELPILKRNRFREEYKFSQGFLAEIEEDEEMRPYLREKGYQAIAGDKYISADEVAYLLTLYRPEPNYDSGRYRQADGALNDYVRGKRYLKFCPKVNNERIEFKDKYKNKWTRKWRMYLSLSLAILLYVAAFSPLLFGKIFPKLTQNLWETLPFSVIFFGTYAFMLMRIGADLYGAEYLVKHQKDRMPELVSNKPQATIVLRERGLRKRNKKN